VLPLGETKISTKVIAQKELMFRLPGVTAVFSAKIKSYRKEDRVVSNRREVHKN
jgi:hypothetical protein